MPQDKLTGKQRVTLLYLHLTEIECFRGEKILERQIRALGPHAWRDYKLGERMIATTVARLEDSLCEKDRRWMEYNLTEGKLAVIFDGPLRRKEYAILEEHDIVTLVKYAQANACDMCLGALEDRKSCELYRTLLQVAPLLHPPENPMMCEYRDMRPDE